MLRALPRLRLAFERLMETLVILLMVALAVVVVLGVTYRKFGAALVWYDEIASVLLAWVTYYGAALAALKRGHIGASGLVDALPPRARVPVVLFGEVCVFGFFILLGYVGWTVLKVLDTDTLVSLPEISVAWTQSVIPIGSALFVIAQALSLPETLRAARERRADSGR